MFYLKPVFFPSISYKLHCVFVGIGDFRKFFAEQYQRLYHEEVWKNIKDRQDIWCKFIWNMFDFSWTPVNRGDRPHINHKGLMTHDRKVKKDSFYFYKANWSAEPVLYILSRRNNQRTQAKVEVAVYTNLDQVELAVNDRIISSKPVDSDIHRSDTQAGNRTHLEA